MIRDGNAAAVAGDNDRCRSAFQRAAQFGQEHGWSGILSVALNGLGDLAMREGRLAEARALCEKSCDAAGRGSLAAGVPLVNLAHIAMVEGDSIEAARFARDALTSARLHGDLLTVAWAAHELAWPLAEWGDLTRSAHLLAAASEFITHVGARRDWTDEQCERAVRKILHERLDAESVQALFDEGRTTSLDEVIRGVLSDSRLGGETLAADSADVIHYERPD